MFENIKTCKSYAKINFKDDDFKKKSTISGNTRINRLRKTKLSLELAQRFDGEIIGADSMQIYKSLDISTAKATPEEQSVAPHHLIDILDPHETYTVTQYRNRALRVIQDVLDRNKLPIVVGGTNYYIEALLWKILVDNDEFVTTPGILPHNEHELPSEELHQKLKELDPKMANRLHPNNKEKF
ncbi:unnamed protein product [Callosobruchus maculatus]|uniref:tRNA dimethylallyltransferase n=1 Tax=Callosobruchus maculatus TaxID=64391 RepID=A0A653CMH7_CALMS|nr:unnamed protein product [Callosobruchus maculatus]